MFREIWWKPAPVWFLPLSSYRFRNIIGANNPSGKFNDILPKSVRELLDHNIKQVGANKLEAFPRNCVSYQTLSSSSVVRVRLRRKVFAIELRCCWKLGFVEQNMIYLFETVNREKDLNKLSSVSKCK